ncbi:MAG TPA: FAD-binding oxidoreductase [Stellaceae bacterium]|nr:FAD-binding oxidoreductase [Stellaceae bacterium]
MDQILDRLRQIVGPQGYLSDPADVAPHLVEGRKLYQGKTALVLKPATTAEVAEIVRTCHEARLPIVPQGGNTGLVGGGVPGIGVPGVGMSGADGHNVVLATHRLNRIREIDAANFTMTVEAGCILATIQEKALEHDRLFPLSLGAQGSCQIGGNISTNAGGIQVLRYGNARELVLGLEVVLPDGQIWDGLRGLRKDNTGYDLKQLFIGAEGTLGIVTAAKLKLFPAPHDSATAFVGLADPEAAMALFTRARGATGDQLTAFELIPRIGIEMLVEHMGCVDPLGEPHPFYALIELSSSHEQAGLGAVMESLLERALEDGLIQDGTIAASTAQARAFWHLREALPEMQAYEGGSIKHDVSVPVSSVAAFLKEAIAAVTERLPGIRPVPFGHAGDGNIHFNLTQPKGADKAAYLARWGEFNDIVHNIVARHGGSISAEHGIGLLKRDELTHYKSALELELMARIKRAVDPENLMNPGKVLVLD